MEDRRYVTSRGIRLSVEVPRTRRERVRGLLGREGIAPDRGLLLVRTRSIHTVRMRFPIVVAFLDAGLVVIETLIVPPGRVLWPRRDARHVLELGRGANVRVGDRILAQEGADQSEHGERGEPERQREHGDDVSGPRGEHDRLPPVRVRPGDPKELQQRAHR